MYKVVNDLPDLNTDGHYDHQKVTLIRQEAKEEAKVCKIYVNLLIV